MLWLRCERTPIILATNVKKSPSTLLRTYSPLQTWKALLFLPLLGQGGARRTVNILSPVQIITLLYCSARSVLFLSTSMFLLTAIADKSVACNSSNTKRASGGCVMRGTSNTAGILALRRPRFLSGDVG